MEEARALLSQESNPPQGDWAPPFPLGVKEVSVPVSTFELDSSVDDPSLHALNGGRPVTRPMLRPAEELVMSQIAFMGKSPSVSSWTADDMTAPPSRMASIESQDKSGPRATLRSPSPTPITLPASGPKLKPPHTPTQLVPVTLSKSPNKKLSKGKQYKIEPSERQRWMASSVISSRLIGTSPAPVRSPSPNKKRQDRARTTSPKKQRVGDIQSEAPHSPSSPAWESPQNDRSQPLSIFDLDKPKKKLTDADIKAEERRRKRKDQQEKEWQAQWEREKDRAKVIDDEIAKLRMPSVPVTTNMDRKAREEAEGEQDTSPDVMPPDNEASDITKPGEEATDNSANSRPMSRVTDRLQDIVEGNQGYPLQPISNTHGPTVENTPEVLPPVRKRSQSAGSGRDLWSPPSGMPDPNLWSKESFTPEMAGSKVMELLESAPTKQGLEPIKKKRRPKSSEGQHTKAQRKLDEMDAEALRVVEEHVRTLERANDEYQSFVSLDVLLEYLGAISSSNVDLDQLENFKAIFEVTLTEIVKQVSMASPDRGIILQGIFHQYRQLVDRTPMILRQREGELRHAQDEVSVLGKQVEKYREDNLELAEKCESQERQLNEVNGALGRREAEGNQLRMDLENTRLSLDQTEKEMRSVMHKMSEGDVDTKSLAQKLHYFAENNFSLRNDLERSLKKIIELDRLRALQDQRIAELKRFEGEIEKMKQMNSMLDNALQDEKNKGKSISRELEDEQNRKQTVKAYFEEVNAALRETKAEVERQKNIVKEGNVRLEVEKQKTETMRVYLEEEKKKRLQMDLALQTAEKKVKQIDGQLAESVKKNRGLVERIIQKKKKLIAKNEEIDRLINKIKSLDNSIADLEAERSSIEKMQQELVEEKQHLREEMEEKMTLIVGQKRKEMDSMQAQVTELEQALHLSKSQQQSLHTKIEEMEDEVDRAKRNVEAAEEKAEKEIERMESLLEQKELEFREELNKQSEGLRQLNQLQTNAQIMRSKASTLNLKYQRARTYAVELSSLKKQLTSFNDDLASTSTEVTRAMKSLQMQVYRSGKPSTPQGSRRSSAPQKAPKPTPQEQPKQVHPTPQPEPEPAPEAAHPDPPAVAIGLEIERNIPFVDKEKELMSAKLAEMGAVVSKLQDVVRRDRRAVEMRDEFMESKLEEEWRKREAALMEKLQKDGNITETTILELAKKFHEDFVNRKESTEAGEHTEGQEALQEGGESGKKRRISLKATTAALMVARRMFGSPPVPSDVAALVPDIHEVPTVPEDDVPEDKSVEQASEDNAAAEGGAGEEEVSVKETETPAKPVDISNIGATLHFADASTSPMMSMDAAVKEATAPLEAELVVATESLAKVTEEYQTVHEEYTRVCELLKDVADAPKVDPRPMTPVSMPATPTSATRPVFRGASVESTDVGVGDGDVTEELVTVVHADGKEVATATKSTDTMDMRVSGVQPGFRPGTAPRDEDDAAVLTQRMDVFVREREDRRAKEAGVDLPESPRESKPFAADKTFDSGKSKAFSSPITKQVAEMDKLNKKIQVAETKLKDMKKNMLSQVEKSVDKFQQLVSREMDLTQKELSLELENQKVLKFREDTLEAQEQVKALEDALAAQARKRFEAKARRIEQKIAEEEAEDDEEPAGIDIQAERGDIHQMEISIKAKDDGDGEKSAQVEVPASERPAHPEEIKGTVFVPRPKSVPKRLQRRRPKPSDKVASKLLAIVQDKKINKKKPQPKSVVWLLKIIRSIYDDTLITDVNTFSFSDFVFEWCTKRYGLKSLVNNTCIDIYNSTSAHYRTNVEVEVFSKFLSEEYDASYVLFYLRCRAQVAEKLDPDTIDDFKTPKSLPMDDVAEIAQNVFGHRMGDDLMNDFLRFLEESGAQSGPESAVSIEMSLFLQLLLEEFEDSILAFSSAFTDLLRRSDKDADGWLSFAEFAYAVKNVVAWSDTQTYTVFMTLAANSVICDPDDHETDLKKVSPVLMASELLRVAVRAYQMECVPLIHHATNRVASPDPSQALGFPDMEFVTGDFEHPSAWNDEWPARAKSPPKRSATAERSMTAGRRLVQQQGL